MIVGKHATFVSHYAIVLVKVVTIFSVIKRVDYLQLHLHTMFFVTTQLRIS